MYIELIDAEKRRVEFPFWRPSPRRLDNLRVGELALVSDATPERFWVKLTSVRKDKPMQGIIFNDLDNKQDYDFGTKIVLERRHVFNVATKKQMDRLGRRWRREKGNDDFIWPWPPCTCPCCNETNFDQ